MPLPDPASRARLQAMGIELWFPRTPAEATARATASDEARVRLSAGGGSWLLVQRRPWDGGHAELLGDIRALLGVDQCRFGQWANSLEAGHGLSELPGRGVCQLLSFGPPPPGAAAPELLVAEVPKLVVVAALDELAASAAARRALWMALRPLLKR